MDDREQSYYNIKKVKKFLIDNNAYHNYLYNLYQENHLNNLDDVSNFFSRHIHEIYSFIEFSFVWSHTKEGFDYWKKLNDKYLQILKTRQLTLF
jgi:hypothetical protein